MDLSGQLIKGTIGTFEVKEIAPPVIGQLFVNNLFANWTADNPDNWILYGTEDATNYVTEVSGGCRIVSDGSNMGVYQTILTAGKRYRLKIKIIEVVSGGVRVYVGGSNELLTSAGIYELDYIAGNQNASILMPAVGGCDVTVEYATVEELSEGYPLLDKGTKYLECTSNGQVGDLQPNAYGTWQFKHKKGGGELRLYFISSLPRGGYGSTEGWFLYITSGEAVSMYRSNPNDQLFITDIDYMKNDVWYEYRITRTKSNSMLVEMRGGEWDDWHTVVPLTGSNPFVDANHTKSTYIAMDDDAGSAIADFKHSNIVKQ